MEEPISSEQTTLFASGKRTFEIGRGPRNIIFLTRRATASETILAWMERRLALTSTGPSEMAPRTNQSANRQLSCDQEWPVPHKRMKDGSQKRFTSLRSWTSLCGFIEDRLWNFKRSLSKLCPLPSSTYSTPKTEDVQGLSCWSQHSGMYGRYLSLLFIAPSIASLESTQVLN